MADEAPRRYEVTIASIDGRGFSYVVCSWFGALKAAVMAASAHASKQRPAVYRVRAADIGAGDKPEAADLVDRDEW
jgi:hypothetical protein